jgi:hypothetical protein
MGPNEQKLKEKLEEMNANGLVNLHFDWELNFIICQEKKDAGRFSIS